ncbi:MAG: DUF4390 domain-containing protein [Nevskiaceae bacterium]|jgi:hypothetical protein|nr:DUF4390 domain-containing protein [Nevskiaceae bacterium]
MNGSRKSGGGFAAALARAFALAMLLICAPPLLSAAESTSPDIASAYVTVRDGVYLLNVQTVYPLTEDISRALDDGVTLNFDLQAQVLKQRRFWYDATLVDVIVRRELSWHAVSERFVLKDISAGGSQQLFMTLEEALEAVGSVQDWPVIVEPQLDPDSAYQISVRAEMRRGRMPDALRMLVFWSDAWSRASDWREWALPR